MRWMGVQSAGIQGGGSCFKPKPVYIDLFKPCILTAVFIATLSSCHQAAHFIPPPLPPLLATRSRGLAKMSGTLNRCVMYGERVSVCYFCRLRCGHHLVSVSHSVDGFCLTFSSVTQRATQRILERTSQQLPSGAGGRGPPLRAGEGCSGEDDGAVCAGPSTLFTPPFMPPLLEGVPQAVLPDLAPAAAAEVSEPGAAAAAHTPNRTAVGSELPLNRPSKVLILPAAESPDVHLVQTVARYRGGTVGGTDVSRAVNNDTC